MEWVTSAVAGFFSGALGAMGLGGGGILIIYLNLFTQTTQTTAQGMNILFFIPVALVAVIIYWRKKLIVWNIALPCILFGLIGAWLGSSTSSFVDGVILRKIFGGLLFIIGVTQLFCKEANASDARRDG